MLIISLDTDERRRFAQVSHEYLIEQLQFTGEESFQSNSPKVKLNFNHPCKELIWTVQRSDVASDSTTRQLFNFTDDKLEYGSSASTAADAAGNLTGRPVGPFGAPMGGATRNNPNPSQTFPTTLAANDKITVKDDGEVVVDGTHAAAIKTALVAGNGSVQLTVGGTTFAVKDTSTTAAIKVSNPPNATVGPTAPVMINGLATVLTDHATGKTHHAGKNPVATAKLQLNGHDRFSERVGRYFNLVQPYQHHTNIPATGINVYSFGLKPEEHQPSGTCNMSRIDNATLALGLTDQTLKNGSTNAIVKVYATNYNVLRIMSGMGGLAYSN